jgi:hypothetical protein
VVKDQLSASIDENNILIEQQSGRIIKLSNFVKAVWWFFMYFILWTYFGLKIHKFCQLQKKIRQIEEQMNRG